MKVKFSLTMVAVGLMVFSGCKASDNQVEEKNTFRDWISIGCVGATDTNTSSIVKTILEKHGIDVKYAGSVVFDIVVPKSEAVSAQNLLKADADLSKAWIQYFSIDKSSSPKSGDPK